MPSAQDRRAATASGRPELLQFSVGVSAGANTNIAVSGIRVGVDMLISVIEVVDPGSAATTPNMVDRTASSSITSDGNIQSTAATNGSGAGARVLVIWSKRTP